MSAKKCAIYGVVCCVSFVLLTYAGGWLAPLSGVLGGNLSFLIPALTATAAFFLPGFLLSKLASNTKIRRTVRPHTYDLAAFSLALSVFFASAGFFAAYFFGYKYILPCLASTSPPASEPYFLWVIFGLICPIALEEYFLRSVFFRSLTRFGTTLAIAASSLLYAMLQRSVSAFFGALLLGAVFCLVTDFVASALPAVVIRVVCVLYYRVFSDFVETYEVYGLEYVFLLLNLIIMLISCYFLLLYFERFLKKGRKLNFRRIPAPVLKSVTAFALNPGMLAFYVLYIMIVCNVI